MICQICTDETDAFAVYDCKHKTCITCSVRFIFLYKKSFCPSCKCLTGIVAFITDSSGCSGKQWTMMYPEIPRIVYKDERAKMQVEALLSKKCKKCFKTFSTMNELKDHYLCHGVVLCNECVQNGKSFWNELKLYRNETILDHKNGKLNEEGFYGHVYCVHCHIYIFDSEHAKEHCNLEHELCEVCGILGMRSKYYNKLEDLEKHYKNAHYFCKFKECQARMCYVFPYKTELFEHLNKFHKTDVKIFEIADHEKCNLPVMDPLYSGRMSSAGTKAVDCSDMEKKSKKTAGPLQRANSRKSATDSSASTYHDHKIPEYLNREALVKERSIEKQRRFWIERLCKSEASGVSEALNEFLNGSTHILSTFEKISKLVGGSTALELFESVNFGSKQTIVSENMKTFRKNVIFPKFKQSEMEEHRNSIDEKSKNAGFKIINLTKKRNGSL